MVILRLPALLEDELQRVLDLPVAALIRESLLSELDGWIQYATLDRHARTPIRAVRAGSSRRIHRICSAIKTGQLWGTVYHAWDCSGAGLTCGSAHVVRQVRTI